MFENRSQRSETEVNGRIEVKTQLTKLKKLAYVKKTLSVEYPKRLEEPRNINN